MGWGEETRARRASLAALDDLLEAVDAYIENNTTTNWSRVVIARDKAKTAKYLANMRVDL